MYTKVTLWSFHLMFISPRNSMTAFAQTQRACGDVISSATLKYTYISTSTALYYGPMFKKKISIFWQIFTEVPDVNFHGK